MLININKKKKKNNILIMKTICLFFIFTVRPFSSELQPVEESPKHLEFFFISLILVTSV